MGACGGAVVRPGRFCGEFGGRFQHPGDSSMWRQPTYSCTRSSTSASSAGRATPRAGPRTACAQARRPGRGGATPPRPPRRSGAAGGCLWARSCCAYGGSILRRTGSRSLRTPEAQTSARRWSRARPALTPSHTRPALTPSLTHTRRPRAPLSRHRHRHRPAPLAPPLLRPPRPFGVALHRPSVARARPWQSAARLLAAEQHCLSVEQICAFRALAAAQSLGALRALRVERERKRRERERRLKERAGPYLP